MNLADAVINFIIFVYQHTLLAWLPIDLPGLTYASFLNGLHFLETTIMTPIYIIDKFFPLTELFILIYTLIWLELVLWLIRLGITGWNMIRGSGAKV